MRYENAMKLAIPRFNDLCTNINVHRAANSPIAKYNNCFFSLFNLSPHKLYFALFYCVVISYFKIYFLSFTRSLIYLCILPLSKQ